MHAPTFPPAEACGFAEEFGHHALHIHPFAYALMVSPVRSVYKVLCFECCAHTYACGFLSDAEVRSSVDLSLTEKLCSCFLEKPGEHHLLIHIQEFFFRNRILSDQLSAHAFLPRLIGIN